jgi:two-component system sensor histidine kinase MtrB
VTESAVASPPLVAGGDEQATTSKRRFGLARARSLGLRNRILLIFTLGSAGLSAVLAITTFGLVRSNLMSQRDDSSIAVAYRNARVIQQQLRGQPDSAPPVPAQLDNLGERPLVQYRDEFTPGRNSRYTEAALPADLVTRVAGDGVPSRMVVSWEGETMLAVGIPLSLDVPAAYYEFFSLEEDNDTLSNVGLSLVFAAVTTTLLGSVLGVFASNRAVRPVAAAAQAAKAIAGGRLDTRLAPTDDPDLSVLANAFNEMASGLQRRVERDARFASDVSHELRSPLMTLSASIEVIQSRRADMPERAQAALDLLTSDVDRFQGLVEDLLEISRFDAGAVRLHLEELSAAEFVRQAVAVSSMPQTPVAVSPRAERAYIEGDRRRLARVIANLVDNARAYGGGVAAISIDEADGEDETLSHIRIAVEDTGAGVPEDERERVFERFSRGTSSGRRAGSEGAGLGLSLVDEHVRLHGGRVWVEDRLDGQPGARFVIELMATEGPA